MANGIIAVTSGSGKNVDTWDRTISATLVQDQFVLPGEYPYASYIICPTTSVSVATANDHQLQIMAGSSNYVRIRRIRIEQAANATTAALLPIQIKRLSTAGTGGTVVTPAKFDSGDAAAGCTAMTLPTGKGTETTMLVRTVVLMRQAISTTQATVDDAYEWIQQPNEKPIIIPAGTSNGICITNESAIAAGSLIPYVEVVETAWLGA